MPPTEASKPTDADLGTGTFGTVANTGGEGVRCRAASNPDAGVITVLPEGIDVEVMKTGEVAARHSGKLPERGETRCPKSA